MIIKDNKAFHENPKAALMEIADKLSCNDSFYPTDLLTNAIINRAMAINDAYFRVTKNNNYIAATPYIRMQMDNCICCYAGLMVNEKHLFKFISHIIAGKDLYKFKDAKKNPLYEKYVVQELNKKYPLFKKGYEYYNDMVHLSNQHFLASQYAEGNHLFLTMERGNYYSDNEISCHNNNMCVINKYLADMLLTLWLPYKEYALEEIQKRQKKENLSKDDIMKELLENYPEIIDILKRNRE